ncbi:dTDP-4-dehydrorhamnose reductase [Amphritea sp. HPY]|uniref:dTDP-4-dehydrorhamnose reductase n=1 Tax=Amphritea sp. HPY TaxID=3421652 RepID=UPI003D7D9065
MIILLLGSSGQVGFELQRTLAPLGTVEAPVRGELELMNESAVDKYLVGTGPELIINAAAWTNVDAAEEKHAEAERLNAGLPAQLAAYAKKNGIRLVHFSSDYIYSGSGHNPWLETSPAGPLSVYGKTKLAGDQAIEQSGANYLIFRTSWVYSARGNNFIKTMLRLGSSNKELNIVADQIGAPTQARLIAQITTQAINNKLKGGLYHLVSRGETSWHGFAQKIFEIARKAGEELSMGQENVLPILTTDYPTPA